jgi:hypothetical protein
MSNIKLNPMIVHINYLSIFLNEATQFKALASKSPDLPASNEFINSLK